MNRLYLCLSILIGIKILLLIVFGLLVFKGHLLLKRRPQGRRALPHESFYCVKSSLKQMNEHFFVAQIVFTNKKNCTLTAQRKSPRRSSERED
jgi:hypothetical protein